MSAGDGDIILRLEDVTKVYSGTVALKHASIDIRKGAVTVLVGENGAGKSTMMKIIAGVEQPTLGRILLDGQDVHFNRPADAEAKGISMVFQELNLLGNLTVAENIFMSREITRGAIHIDHARQESRALQILDRLEAGIRPGMLVEDLMIGQQQLVEIAKAVSLNSRIIIFDEPTSALSAAEVDVLFRVIADLKKQGVAIVYISHRLEELIRIGDYITVLRDGAVTGSERMANVDTRWIVRQMIGSDAKDFAKQVEHDVGAEVLRQPRPLGHPFRFASGELNDKGREHFCSAGPSHHVRPFLEQGIAGDHFRHHEAGTMGMCHQTKGLIRDARHGCQKDRVAYFDGADKYAHNLCRVLVSSRFVQNTMLRCSVNENLIRARFPCRGTLAMPDSNVSGSGHRRRRQRIARRGRNPQAIPVDWRQACHPLDAGGISGSSAD